MWGVVVADITNDEVTEEVGDMELEMVVQAPPNSISTVPSVSFNSPREINPM